MPSDAPPRNLGRSPSSPVGRVIVASPSRRPREAGFLTRQIVADLDQADGELWHGRRATSLITLRIERTRAFAGELPPAASRPLHVRVGTVLTLGYGERIEPLRGARWTRLCAVGAMTTDGSAVRQGEPFHNLVQARVTGLHHIDGPSAGSWTWHEDGTVTPA